MIKGCRRFDRQVEHRGHRHGFRPSWPRGMPRERIEKIKSAELPKTQAAERCSRVGILTASVSFQMRYGDREGREAVILKGEASSAKQLARRAQPHCKRGGNVVELPLDVLERAEGFVDLRRRHEAPSSRQTPPDVRE